MLSIQEGIRLNILQPEDQVFLAFLFKLVYFLSLLG